MFNTQKAQQPIKISHPLIRDAYLVKDTLADKSEQDVLVLEARGGLEDTELGGFDSYLYDIVTDLENLKEQAQKQFRSIDRVDICTH